MIRSALVVLVLASVAVIALLSAVRAGFTPAGSEQSERDRRALRGPALPEPGFLPGAIRVSTVEGCASIDLGTVEEVRLGPSERCGSTDSSRPLASESLVLSNGVELGERDFHRSLTGTNSEPIVVVGQDQRADGVAAVVIERRAGVLLRERFERESEPLPIGSRESFAAAIANSHGGSLPELVVQLWQGDVLLGAIPLPTVGYYPVAGHALGEIVKFGPNGTELIVASGGDEGRLLLVDLKSERVILGLTRQNGFAWSPDGTWLALAHGDGIDLLGVTRSQPVYVLPVQATSVTWE